MNLTKDKSFYKSIVKISIPIGLQNLITFSVSMADTIMLGRLGEINLSASSIANNLFFILMVLMFGVGGGASVMSSQYYGKKDIDSIHKIMSIMYRLCVSICVLFILIGIFLPELFMRIYTDNTIVIEEGSKYLRVISLSYIFYGITNCTINILRTVKTVKISLLVYGISLFVNVFFNWALIFGNLGFPKLGIYGAAIATVLSRITEFITIIIYMKYFEKKIGFKMSYLKHVDKPILLDFKKTCTPILLNELFFAIGSSMISIIVGRMGVKVVAANSINNIVNQFAMLFIHGLSSASSVIIGNTIGKKDYKKVTEYANSIIILSVIGGLISGVIIYSLRGIVISLYNVSDETSIIARQIMLSTAIIATFRSVTSNTLMGILRGGGDNKYVFKVEMALMWGVSIPLGFLGAFVFDLPIYLVFLLIRSDEVLKSIVGVRRILSNKWITNVTRD